MSKVNSILDNFSKVLVGKLCQRFEVVEKMHSNLDSSYVRELQVVKQFCKNLIYEETRVLKRVLFCVLDPQKSKTLVDIIYTKEKGNE